MQGSEPEVSAVRTALYRGDRQAALALVGAGADLNEFDLAALGDAEALRRVLADNAGASRSRSADGFTALHFATFAFAADNGHSEIAAQIEKSTNSPLSD